MKTKQSRSTLAEKMALLLRKEQELIDQLHEVRVEYQTLQALQAQRLRIRLHRKDCRCYLCN
jgi:hypothetical protein